MDRSERISRALDGFVQSNRNIDSGSHFGMSGVIVCRERLLHKLKVEAFQSPNCLYCFLGRRIVLIRIDSHRYVCSNSIAHGFTGAYVYLIMTSDLQPDAADSIFFEIESGFFRHFFWSLLTHRPVEWHGITSLASEQPVGWQVCGLACDIPER